MGQVAGEVVGAELILGVEPLLFEVVGPGLELGPIGRGEVGVPLDLGDGAEDQEDIAGLLHRHLVDLGPLAAAVNLAVGDRIGPQVVRGEREFPSARGRVVQDRGQRRLGQGRAEQEEDRRRRVDHVDGGDAAVAEILLREQQRLAVRVGHQLVRRQRLAIGERGHFGVLLAAGPGEVGHQLGVEGRGSIAEGVVSGLGPVEEVVDRRPVAGPVGAEVAAEIGDRKAVVVGQHQVLRDGPVAHRAQVDGEGQDGRVDVGRPGHPGVDSVGELAVAAERIDARAIGPDRRQCPRLGGRGVGVSPVDPEVVPLAPEDILIGRADPEDLQAAHPPRRPGDFLAGRVDRQGRARREIQRRLMRLAVSGPDVPGDVGQGPRQDVEVVGQAGGQEGEGDADLGPFELVDRPGGQDLQPDLGQGGDVLGLVADQAEGLAVDPGSGRPGAACGRSSGGWRRR